MLAADSLSLKDVVYIDILSHLRYGRRVQKYTYWHKKISLPSITENHRVLNITFLKHLCLCLCWVFFTFQSFSVS